MIQVLVPQGELPKYNPRLLEDNQAQKAENCVLEQGDCRSLRGPSFKDNLNSNTQALLFIGGAWLERSARVSLIHSPIISEDNRYYYTWSTGRGRKADDHIGAMDLGVPRPTTGPTLTLGGTAGDNIIRSSVYIYTRVTAWGEESAPSQPSGLVDIYEDQFVSEFTGLSDNSDDHVTHYRLYRAVGGASTRNWLLVPYQTTAGVLKYDADNNIRYDIPKADIATAKDGMRDADLFIPLESMEHIPPPSDLKYLTDFSHGLIGGTSDKQMCFAEPWLPYAWPIGYRYMMDSPAVGVGHIRGTPVAFSEDKVYIFEGASPGAFHQRKLSETHSCVATHSIVSTAQGVFFASRDGLCIATYNGVDVLTANVWTRDQWNEFDLENLHGFYFRNSYIGFFDGDDKGFMLTLAGDQLYVTSFDLPYDFVVGYHLASNDKLYLGLQTSPGNRDLYEFDGGSDITFTWKSKIFRVPKINYGCFKIGGASGDSDVKIWADGVVVFDQTVDHNKSIRLPVGFRPQEYEIELKGTTKWHGFALANQMEALNAI